MRRWPYRCSRCGQRVTFKHRLEWYRHEPVCPNCGFRLRLDNYRKQHEHKLHICYCDGYPFPHRSNSLSCRTGKEYGIFLDTRRRFEYDQQPE